MGQQFGSSSQALEQDVGSGINHMCNRKAVMAL